MNKIISKDNIELFIPSEHPYFKQGYFSLINDTTPIPIHYNILKYIFFNFENPPLETLIELIKTILPMELSGEKIFIKQLYKKLCPKYKRKINFLYFDEKKAIQDLREDWDLNDLEKQIDYLRTKSFHDCNFNAGKGGNFLEKRIIEEYPNLDFLYEYNTFYTDFFKFLKPKQFNNHEIMKHILKCSPHEYQIGIHWQYLPMHYICKYGNEELIKYTIDNYLHKCKFDQSMYAPISPIYYLYKYSTIEMVNYYNERIYPNYTIEHIEKKIKFYKFRKNSIEAVSKKAPISP